MSVAADTKRNAVKVLARYGRAPNVAASMNDEELTVLASLLGDDGQLIDGANGLYRELMIEHYGQRKATDAEFDEPATAVPVYIPVGPQKRKAGNK